MNRFRGYRRIFNKINHRMDNIENVRAFMEERGKKGTAEYIKINEAEDLLNRIFQIIFDPENEIDNYDSINWMRWLMAGGNTPEEFATAVRKYDNATTCGLVWTANFVAYRCRTCGISPCMSLCAECFQRGHHEGHDFNMFRSQAGGACDCGDTSVMKTCGFCDRHGVHNITRKLPPPTELLYIPTKMAPRIFLRLILHLRELSLIKSIDPTSQLDTNEFLTVLSNLSSMGAAMRKVLTKALVSRELYSELTSSLSNNEIEEADIILHNNCAPDLSEGDSLYMYFECQTIFDDIEGENYASSSSSQLQMPKFERVPLCHTTFLEELVFWTVKYEFPQKVVCFLLNMLPDSVYKEALTESFVMHYSRISLVLEASTDPDTLSNRVVHVSVQLFSNEQLAVRMTGNFNLLEVMVISLKRMMGRILIPSPAHFLVIDDEELGPDVTPPFQQKVVNCASAVMKEHCYWPLVSDLNNVLSHRPIALQFMQHPTLPEMWFSFLAYYQGMNINKREISQHVEFEPNTYYAAFSAELEASAYPMWAMLSHLVSAKTIALTKAMLCSCMKILKNWLRGANINIYPKKFDEQVSFHIPLHRYLATFICQAVNVQGVPLEEVIPPLRFLPMLMKHPLRIQTAFYEITHGLWIRNGLQIKGQAMTYIQCNFCSSMVDADLYLLQICITRQPLNDVMVNLIEKFSLKKTLSFISFENTTGKSDVDSESAMLEGFLQFLATLTNIRTNLGQSFSTTTRLEMVTLLCMTDKTHSQLTELMPERCGIAPSRDFDSILSNVAEYKAPIFEASGNMQQGLYVPKSCVWEQFYDPVHVLLRSVHRRDFQASMDRYTDYVKQSGKMPTTGSLWPPYRIPDSCNSAYIDPRIVLNNKTFHALIWICLYKSVHLKNVTEHVISLTVYLLEMALSIDCKTTFENSPPACTEQEYVVEDLKLNTWFETDELSKNLKTVINKVKVDRHLVPYYCKFDNHFYPGYTSLNDPTRGQDSISSGSGSSATERGHRNSLLSHELLRDSISQDEDNSDSDMDSSTPTSESSCSDKFTDSAADNAVQKGQYVHCDMNESIISLLLKLHSNLSGIPNSFDPDNVDKSHITNRIASGPEFVEKVLIRIMMLDEDCRRNVYATRESIWPTAPLSSEQEKIEAEEAEKKAKKILAKERQMKIIEDFINRQKKFLENTKETMENEMDWEVAVEPKQTPAIEYHCVICNGSSASTDERPMAIIVLMQATSVIGHKHRSSCQPVLPVSDDEVCRFQPENTLAADFEKKMEELSHEFSDSSWWLSINNGWEGGIHIQTCGHHIHIECIKSYLQSLRGQQRVVIDKGEFLCPLCRQLSNSILPIAPALGSCAPAASPKSTNIRSLITDITDLMTIDPIIELTVSPLEDALQRTMEDINSVAHTKMSQNSDSRQVPSSMLFVTSIARINLEVEIIQRGGNLCTVSADSTKITEINDLAPKRSCMVPLFYMLGAHARQLLRWVIISSWSQTAGIPEAHNALDIPLHPNEKSVPMLIKDVSAILIQFVLLLPFNLDHNYYECLVKLLYNLLYFQIISQLLTNETPMERNYWRKISDPISERMNGDFSLDNAMKLVISLLDRDMFFDEDDSIDEIQEPSRAEIEKNIQELALPFLRLASMIRYHVYNDPIPNDIACEKEFERLIYYLRLAEPSNLNYFSPTVALTWQSSDTSVINDWFSNFSQYIHRNQVAAKSFLKDLHIKWKQPRLLQLPNEYSKLFQFYHRKECLRCHTVPQEASVCLVCGKLVCLKQTCCKFGGKMCEAVQHSLSCGAGTAMFLIVPYSTIIIIRGRRTCIWGSVYLDKFGEEDRELKRGKPLYLSNERYRLLEQQWLSHRFDNINKKWIWHRDSL